MRTKLTLACALTAFVAVAGGTAEATGLVHTSGIAKGAVTFNRLSPGVQKMVAANAVPRATGAVGATGAAGATGLTGATGFTGPMGTKGATGPQGLQGVAGSEGTMGLKGDTGAAGAPGTNGMNGASGQHGAKGDTGANGSPGGKGDTGAKGWTGADGAKGDTGLKGADGKDGVDAPTASYGAAMVYVSRGGNAAGEWARYSTTLGSPVGDTTGGSFRFTCSDAQAPCTVGVRVATLSDTSRNVLVRPRVLIERQDYNAGGPQTMCEYGDGVTNGNPFATVATQTPSATPVLTALTMGVGNTDDCGIAGPGGTVNAITVPSGYYNVTAGFLFM